MATSDSNRKSPCFQFYPADFLSDEHVRLMSMQERGAYITLLCYCWNEGSLPADLSKLARLCGAPLTSFKKFWPAIAPCFKPKGDDRLVNSRLDRERKKQKEWREGQAQRGKAGADARWRKHTDAMPPPSPPPSQTHASAIDSPMAKNGSSFSSSVFGFQSSERKNASQSAEDALGERASAFIERYQALYTKHRKGAHYLVRPHLDFPKAKDLCRTWPDDRLDKLAVVFLTTDHRFAEEGSRTIGQFAAMASWCDGRLAEAGIA